MNSLFSLLKTPAVTRVSSQALKINSCFNFKAQANNFSSTTLFREDAKVEASDVKSSISSFVSQKLAEIGTDLKEENSRRQGRSNNQARGQSADYSNFSHVLNVHSSLNNTIITLCNSDNQVICTASCGTAGFKKARRSGFESAYQAAAQLVQKAKDKRQNVTSLFVKFKGFGPGREAVFRSIRSHTDWQIVRITDVTPIPHNGCRPPKPRRL